MEYLAGIILAVVGVGLNQRFSPASRRMFVMIILLYIVMLMGLRYRVGMDTLGYMSSYKNTVPLDNFFTTKIFREHHEPGYLLVCSLCRLFTKEFWPVQLIMSAITNSCIFIFLYRNCRNVFMGIFLFLILQWLYFSTEIMRESAAIGIFLVNYRNMREKRWIRYYLFSLLSISFHYSAILIWFLPFVKYLRPNIFFYIFCVGILAVTPLVEKFNEMLSLGVVSEKISTYVKDVDNVNMNWRISEMIKTGIPAMLTLILYHFSRLRTPFRHLILLQIIFCCGAFAIPVIFQRFTNYTTLFVTAALANYLVNYHVKVPLRLTVIGLICLTQSIYYYSLFPTWYPYVSIFEPVTIHEREALFRRIWK
ncbi:MAG: EpsG family protein [Muribaculaceae bacterium]|nr:EpsG family protein [Muribaculaceae bacterium]MDE6753118.1 EpsG family protein [Muribaculaceae bacterium]